MLKSNGGGFKIKGQDVNSASHATYSQALRNNALWCAVLQEVGWHLQEIIREEYLYFEPQGIRLFDVDMHIHKDFFADDGLMPSPYDNLLETQQEETQRMCDDMKRKYARITDNVPAVKHERYLLYHTIAEFLAAHMPSSTRITTRALRLGDDPDKHSSESHDDRAIAGLVTRMQNI
jgi:hypothetical protein